MEKQYNNISVFKSKPSDNPKAPQFNVVIEMADGTNYRGGLWQKVSKGGLSYLSGSLEVDTGDYAKGAAQPAPRAQRQAAPQRQDAETIDW